MECKLKDLSLILETVKKETVPALGCTEPVAVALACAYGALYIKGKILNVSICVSENIFKNGKSVIIPNTHQAGLKLAGGLGLVCGNPKDSLCIFKNVNDRYILAVKEMIEDGKISLKPVESKDKVYVDVNIKAKYNNVHVVLSSCHSHISLIEVDGKKVYEDVVKKVEDKSHEKIFSKLSFKDLREYIENIDISKIDFINEGIDMNMKAAVEGLNKKRGLTWGRGLLELQRNNEWNIDASMKSRILTAAGADIRMSGGFYPIITSGGSGNQGLNIVIPPVVVAKEKNIERERLIRAIFFGHCINNYVKIYTGKLSSMCGCAIASGIGASAAITWMLGGDDTQIQGAVHNMLADITGMICDGAKETCALKLSTSAAEAVLCSYMALNNIIVPLKTGIISSSVEETIKNIGDICKKGMGNVDKVIIKIIGR